MDRCDYGKIPTGTLQAMKRWVEEACPTGGFLKAVLSNDLIGAVGSADSENVEAIVQIVTFLYNRCPSACWGSREHVANWPDKLEENRAEGVFG